MRWCIIPSRFRGIGNMTGGIEEASANVSGRDLQKRALCTKYTAIYKTNSADDIQCGCVGLRVHGNTQ